MWFMYKLLGSFRWGYKPISRLEQAIMRETWSQIGGISFVHGWHAGIKEPIIFTHLSLSLIYTCTWKYVTGAKYWEVKIYLIWDRRVKSLLPLIKIVKTSPCDCVTLSCMCNRETQLSELRLLPWCSDRNTQGQSKSTTALPWLLASSILLLVSLSCTQGWAGHRGYRGNPDTCDALSGQRSDSNPCLHRLLFIPCCFNVLVHHLSPAGTLQGGGERFVHVTALTLLFLYNQVPFPRLFCSPLLVLRRTNMSCSALSTTSLPARK